MAFIEGCPHVRGGLYRGVSSLTLGVAFMRGVLTSGVAFVEGVLTLGVAFIEGCPHVRGGLYRGVSSHQGWLL